MSVALLIDDTGALYDASGAEVRRRLGRKGETSDLIAAAVRDHHWVGLIHYATSVEVCLDCAGPAPAALQVGIDLLMGTLAKEIAVAHYRSTWHRERFHSAASAILRIEELTASTVEQEKAVPFRATRRAIQDLWRDGNRALIMALQQYQSRLGRIDLGEARRIGAWRTMGTTSVFERTRRSDRFIVRAVSPLIRFYESGGGLALEGHDMREQPNRDYCDWVSQAYSRALQKTEVLVDDVDAVVRKPDGSALMMSYRRLIAPYQASNGSKFVVTSTELIPLPRRTGT